MNRTDRAKAAYEARAEAVAGPKVDHPASADCRWCEAEGKACGRAHLENIRSSWVKGSTAFNGVAVDGTAPAPRSMAQRSPAQARAGARKASGKQVDFLRKLLAKKDLTGTAYTVWTEDILAGLTSVDASRAIDDLQDRPWDNSRPAYEPTAARQASTGQVTEDGMYRDPATGTIFKVQVAKQGSGNLYAKKLTQVEWEDDGSGGTRWSFEYAPGAIRRIRPEWKMTVEQAAEFGRLYGVCCVCGRDLTDERSIEAGIGPICARSF